MYIYFVRMFMYLLLYIHIEDLILSIHIQFNKMKLKYTEFKYKTFFNFNSKKIYAITL